MRGKGDGLETGNVIKRITPAYAGKSIPTTAGHIQMEDHPRLCGEKYNRTLFVWFYTGSPPPMRGKGTVRGKSTRPWRITPAYAGKSTWKCMPFVTSQDHPRLCGEKHMEVYAICDITGSPPPMRGKVAIPA